MNQTEIKQEHRKQVLSPWILKPILRLMGIQLLSFSRFLPFLGMTLICGHFALADQISDLLARYQANTMTPHSTAVYAELGKQVGDLRKKLGPKAFDTPKGKELLQHYAHSINFQAIQKAMKDCNSGHAHVKAAIVDAAMNTKPIEIDCGLASNTTDGALKNIDDILRSMKKDIEPLKASDFTKDVIEEDLKISVGGLVGFQHGFGKSPNAEALMDQICGKGPKNTCGSHLRKTLVDHANGHLAVVRKENRTYTHEQAAREFISVFDEINAHLALSESSTRPGHSREEMTKRYEFAKEKLRSVIQKTPVGYVLMTNRALHAGNFPKGIEDAEVIRKNGEEFYSPRFFGALSVEDVKAASLEVEKSIFSHMEMVLEARQKDARSALMQILPTSPLAVGRILMKNPEAAGFVCQLLGELDREEGEVKRNDEIAETAGTTAGIASLFAGGVGFIGGRGINWLFRGALPATRFVTGAQTASVALAGAAMLPGAYFTGNALNKYADAIKFEQAYLAGVTDASALASAQASLEEFNQAKDAAIQGLMINGALRGAGSLLAGLSKSGVFSKASQSAADFAAKSKALKAATEALKQLVQNPKTKALLENARNFMNNEKFGEFIGHLAGMTEQLRMKTLEALKAFGPERLQRAVDEAMENAAKNC